MTTNEAQQQWASPDEWEAHREVISNLYWDQDKTLKDVAEVMQVEYGFCATERMYKARFKKWGLAKYMKADQVALARRQAGQGKITVPIIRGRLAGPKRLKQQLSRKLPQEFATLVGSAGRRPASALVSRNPSPLSSSIDPPSQFRIVEGCLKCVMDYTHGKIQAGIWNRFDNYLPEDEVDTWNNSVVLSRVMIERGKLKDGFRMLDICMKNYTGLLDKEFPLLMMETYSSILNLSRARFDLAEAVLKYIAGLCRIRLGATHPYTRLWFALNSVGMGQVRQVSAVLFKAQMIIFEEFFDPTAEFLLLHIIDTARQLHFYGHLSATEAESSIIKAIHRRETRDLPDTIDFVCWAKGMIAFIHKFDGNFERSSAYLDEIEPYVRSPPQELSLFTTYEYYNQRCGIVKDRPGSTYEEIIVAFEARLAFARQNAGPAHSFTSISVAELDWQYGLANDIEASKKLHEEFDFESSWDALCMKEDSRQPALCDTTSPQSSLASTFTPSSSAVSSTETQNEQYSVGSQDS